MASFVVLSVHRRDHFRTFAITGKWDSETLQPWWAPAMLAKIYVSSSVQGASHVSWHTLWTDTWDHQIKHDKLQAKALAAIRSSLTEHNIVHECSSSLKSRLVRYILSHFPLIYHRDTAYLLQVSFHSWNGDRVFIAPYWHSHYCERLPGDCWCWHPGRCWHLMKLHTWKNAVATDCLLCTSTI